MGWGSGLRARRAAALALGLALLLAGCGGSGDTSQSAAPALTVAAVKACLLKAGAAPEDLAPQQPKGAPRHFQHVYFKGPEANGHIAIMLSRKPIFSPALARAYTAQQEYLATAVRGGRAMILLDNYKPNPNRALAFKCVVG